MIEARTWEVDPPPVSTKVQASYDGEVWQEVTTCGRGCCVWADGFAMVLPSYWKPTTDAKPSGVTLKLEMK